MKSGGSEVWGSDLHCWERSWGFRLPNTAMTLSSSPSLDSKSSFSVREITLKLCRSSTMACRISVSGSACRISVSCSCNADSRHRTKHIMHRRVHPLAAAELAAFVSSASQRERIAKMRQARKRRSTIRNAAWSHKS